MKFCISKKEPFTFILETSERDLHAGGTVFIPGVYSG